MNHFAIVLPVGFGALGVAGILFFVLILFAIPGALLIALKQSFGVKKQHRKTIVDRMTLIKKIAAILMYHFVIALVMLLSWPQLYSPIHTGIDVPGLIYILAILLVWTGTGMVIIYSWHMARGNDKLFPGIGFFARLYIWHFAFFFILRESIYYFIAW